VPARAKNNGSHRFYLSSRVWAILDGVLFHHGTPRDGDGMVRVLWGCYLAGLRRGVSSRGCPRVPELA
jgi:hypothetical protein